VTTLGQKTHRQISKFSLHQGKKTIDYYSLDAIWYLLQKRSLPHSAYVREASANGVSVIKRPDRKDLLDFILGDRTSVKALDPTIQQAPPIVIKADVHPTPAFETPTETESVVESKIAESDDDAGFDDDHGAPSPSHSPVYSPKNDLVMDNSMDHIEDKIPTPVHSGPPSIAPSSPQMSVLTDNITTSFVASDSAPPSKKPRVHETPEASQRDRMKSLREKILNKKKDRKLVREELDFTKKADDFNVDLHKPEILDIHGFFNKREKTFQNRTSVLQVPTRSFSCVLKILEDMHISKKRDMQRRKPVENIPKPSRKTYSRFDQEQRLDTGGFNIDVRHGFLTSGQDKIRPDDKNDRPGRQVKDVDRENVAKSMGLQKKSSKKPIIIIPAASTSLITAFNAKSILEQFKYVDSKDCRNKADANERAGDFLITRKKILENGEQVAIPYRIVNNVNRLEPKDWDRVVAVFVQGPTWQFKGWPWVGDGSNSGVEDIFLKTCGFHLRFEHLPLHQNIKKWHVTSIDLEQNGRHQDAAKLRKMWHTLDHWISKNKPVLRS